MELNINSIGTGHQYMPSEEAIEWCTSQKVINYNNLEINTVMILAIPIILTFLLEYMLIKNKYRYTPLISYSIRISIYIFFYIYLVHVRMGV